MSCLFIHLFTLHSVYNIIQNIFSNKICLTAKIINIMG